MKSVAIGVTTLLTASAAWSQAYQLDDNELNVAAEHWPAWNFPAGSLDFSAEGVRPAFVREQVNASLDASAFTYADGVQGGIRNAGTNRAGAANILDGREDTFWEPDLADALDTWWVEIDLGRLVWAQKVVVKFAAEGAGDPFLQFKVLTANGDPAFLQSESFNYLPAGHSEGLNKSQRVYEFELQPTRKVDPGLTGRLIQFLQVVATASDLGRAEQISAARWHSLPEQERGDVLHFRRESSGVLRPIDQAAYEAIEAQWQGPVQYYRRERPRLTEVEVWTVGDNISLGALERGGEIIGYGNLGAERLTVDGEWGSFWSVEVGFSGNDPAVVFQDPHRNIYFDLGTWYWVNRAAIVFGDRYSRAFPNYVIALSDGSRAPDGSLSYVALTGRGQEDGETTAHRSLLFQDNVFPLTKARYFRMNYTLVAESARPAIREIQLYGRGFLPEVSLASEPIELGRTARILSAMHWTAHAPPGTQVRVRTRSGNQLDQNIRYFTSTGQEVNEAKYRKLLSFQRGDSTVTIIPGPDWSPWSLPYSVPGAPITSPSPRRYVMIEATLRSDDPDAAALLRSLRLSLDAPLANQIRGEIAPNKTPQRGQPQTFTLLLQPAFQDGNRGFDQVLVELPPGAEMDLIDGAIGAEQYGRDQLERLPTGADSLWVRLPAPVGPEQDRVSLRFSGALYLVSNAFEVQVGHDQVWQRVDASRGLTVFTPFTTAVLGKVTASSNPFTPNGDGINDVVELAFPVFQVQGAKALILEVYGLDGERVQRIEQAAATAAGHQRLTWDGRDRTGRLLPPGLYLCRVGVEVDAEGEQTTSTKLVASVY